MAKVLISGASGFVGQNLIKYLTDYHFEIDLVTQDIIRTSKLFPSLSGRIFSYENFDMKMNYSYIVHLAGKAHDLKNVSGADEYYKINTDLTIAIYELFLKSSCKAFVFISTVKAAADQIYGVLTEECIPQPKTHYGKSKLLAEEYILNHPLPEAKSFYILRPCMIHGPGNKGNLNLLYNFVSKGLPYPLAAYENKRSFLSVENLCFVIKELLKRDDIPSGVYNVADDEALSTTEVVSLLAKSLNRASRLLKTPTSLIITLARVGDVIHLPLNSERLSKLTESYVVSNAKIKSVLKNELPLSAREGILRTARSFNNG